MEITDYVKEIDNLKKQLLKKEAIIKEKNAQLKCIYGMRSWRLLLVLVRAKRQVYIFIKRLYRLFGLSFLFIFTFLVTGYLFLLKKIRKTIIFPGG